MDTSHAQHAGRVEDQDYYHINRLVHWSSHGFLNVGNEIDFGDTSNPYFRFFEEQQIMYPATQNDGSKIQIPGVAFLKLVRDGQVNAPPDHADFAEVLAGHLAREVRELVFEDVRRREFPHLPSRQRCGWLIPNQAGVKYWLRTMDVGGQFQVVRVRVQGRLHTASESYLAEDSMPLEEAIRRAREYWLGTVEQAGTEEILFEGRMRVEEVMPPDFYA